MPLATMTAAQRCHRSPTTKKDIKTMRHGKNLPGRLVVNIRLNESVSHVVGGVSVSRRDAVWVGGGGGWSVK